MSPKKSAAKKAPAVAAKASKKSKAAAQLAEEGQIQVPEMGADEREELEEQAEEAASRTTGSRGGADAALAAAASSGAGEMPQSFKNFRHHPDMENFYRFIYENDLRREALEILDQLLSEKKNLKAVKFAKSQAH